MAGPEFYTIDFQDPSTQWIAEAIYDNVSKSEIIEIFQGKIKKVVQVSAALKIDLRAEGPASEHEPAQLISVKVIEGLKVLHQYSCSPLNFNMYTSVCGGHIVFCSYWQKGLLT